MKARPISNKKSRNNRFARCPECEENSPIENVELKRLVGGENYYYFDDGYWFEENDLEHITSAYCIKCNERSNWYNWPEFNDSEMEAWECSNCGAQYAEKQEGDECCL